MLGSVSAMNKAIRRPRCHSHSKPTSPSKRAANNQLHLSRRQRRLRIPHQPRRPGELGRYPASSQNSRPFKTHRLPKMKTLKSQVQHTANRMADNPSLDDDDIVDLLINDGLADLLATRLNAFVPHAFGRLLIRLKHNPEFPSTFLLGCHGHRVQVQFSRGP